MTKDGLLRLPLSAFFAGLASTLRSPGLVILLYLVTVVAAFPAGLLMHERISAVLGAVETVAPSRYQVSLVEWNAVRDAAQFPAETLEPRVLGAVAPLGLISDAFDARIPSRVVLVGTAVVSLAWLFLLGGVLERFIAEGGSQRSQRSFMRGCFAHWRSFVGLGLLSAATCAILGLVVHRWMLVPLYERLASGAGEPSAFALRIGMYVVFGLIVVGIKLVADYARISRVIEPGLSVAGMIAAAVHLIRRHPVQVGLLAVFNGGAVVALLAAYAAFELGTGGVALSNRALVAGQAVVAGRSFLTLVSTASQARLARAVSLRATPA